WGSRQRGSNRVLRKTENRRPGSGARPPSGISGTSARGLEDERVVHADDAAPFGAREGPALDRARDAALHRRAPEVARRDGGRLHAAVGGDHPAHGDAALEARVRLEALLVAVADLRQVAADDAADGLRRERAGDRRALRADSRDARGTVAQGAADRAVSPGAVAGTAAGAAAAAAHRAELADADEVADPPRAHAGAGHAEASVAGVGADLLAHQRADGAHRIDPVRLGRAVGRGRRVPAADQRAPRAGR